MVTVWDVSQLTSIKGLIYNVIQKYIKKKLFIKFIS
jgi:hypothetical protein